MDEIRSSSLEEKRRRYFERRDKHLAEKKGFHKIDMDTGPRGPQFLMVLLCVLGIALALYRIFGPAPFASENDLPVDTFNTRAEDRGASDGARIQPELVKDELMAVESALFTPQVDSLEQVLSSTSFQAEVLVRALKGSQDPRQDAAANALEELSETLSGDLDLEGVRAFKDNWLRFRSRHFQKAPWFSSGGGANLSHSVALAVYRGVADDLLQHVGLGIEESEAFIQEASQVGTLDVHQDERDRLLRDWQSQAQSWSEEVTRLGRQAPENPDAIPSSSLAAVQQLNSALRDAQGKLPTDRLPTNADVTALEGALLKAQLAVEALSKDQ